MWKQTAIAVRFFDEYLPYTEMKSSNELTSSDQDYCYAKVGEAYAIYLPAGESTTLQLDGKTFSVSWLDPKRGGDLQGGSIERASGPGIVDLGRSPTVISQDWVVLLKAL